MDILVFFVSISLAIAYIYLIVYFSDGWDETLEWQAPVHYIPRRKVSVIVPVRNEKNIDKLIESLISQIYPKSLTEIVIVDDHSEPRVTLSKNHSQSIKLIHLPINLKGKKAALTHGIQFASGEIIMCIDGDCEVGNKWISETVSFVDSQNLVFTTGMVHYRYKSSLLEAFQTMDAAGTMLITAAAIQKDAFYLANGANMAFTKKSFETIGGFSSHREIATGDDLFLIQEMERSFPDQVRFLKSPHAIVTTHPTRTYQALFNQRQRWASKVRYYASSTLTKVQGFVGGIYIWFIICMIFACWMNSGIALFSALFLWFIKSVMDYLLIAKSSRFQNIAGHLKYFIPASLLQMIIVVMSVWWGFFTRSYRWKDRLNKG